MVRTDNDSLSHRRLQIPQKCRLNIPHGTDHVHLSCPVQTQVVVGLWILAPRVMVVTELEAFGSYRGVIGGATVSGPQLVSWQPGNPEHHECRIVRTFWNLPCRISP